MKADGSRSHAKIDHRQDIRFGNLFCSQPTLSETDDVEQADSRRSPAPFARRPPRSTVSRQMPVRRPAEAAGKEAEHAQHIYRWPNASASAVLNDCWATHLIGRLPPSAWRARSDSGYDHSIRPRTPSAPSPAELSSSPRRRGEQDARNDPAAVPRHQALFPPLGRTSFAEPDSTVLNEHPGSPKSDQTPAPDIKRQRRRA